MVGVVLEGYSTPKGYAWGDNVEIIDNAVLPAKYLVAIKHDVYRLVQSNVGIS